MSEINLKNRLWNVLISRVSFELYTIPNCNECERVKRFLEEQGVEYREINAEHYTEGRKEVNDYYMYSKNGGGYKIKKDNRGGFIFPILRWRGLSQGLEDISELFKNVGF